MKMKLLPILALLVGAQTAGAQGPALTLPAGSVVTDGSINPNAISDAIALRMFYAMAKNAGNNNSSRITAAPGKGSLAVFLTQLNAGDAANITDHVTKWSAMQAQKPTFEQLDVAAKAELIALRSTMSAHGWAAFEAELTRRKATIKVYEVPAH